MQTIVCGLTTLCAGVALLVDGSGAVFTLKLTNYPRFNAFGALPGLSGAVNLKHG
jgi:hypothetical protein